MHHNEALEREITCLLLHSAMEQYLMFWVFLIPKRMVK